MKQYLEVMKDIYHNGINTDDRTGTGRRHIYGVQKRFDLADGFPLVTTRKIYTKAAFVEMLWFIHGETDTVLLNDANVHIWDAWAVNSDDITKYVDEKRNEIVSERPDISDQTLNNLLEAFERYIRTQTGGGNTIGPMYGYVWRNGGMTKNGENIDQLKILLRNLKEQPYSSRHVITAWLPEHIPDETISPQENVMQGYGALAPCHILQQYFVIPPKNTPIKIGRTFLGCFPNPENPIIVNIPAIVAVNHEANAPPSMALKPTLAISCFLSGANALIPPTCIPIEAKLANPQSA